MEWLRLPPPDRKYLDFVMRGLQALRAAEAEEFCRAHIGHAGIDGIMHHVHPHAPIHDVWLCRACGDTLGQTLLRFLPSSPPRDESPPTTPA